MDPILKTLTSALEQIFQRGVVVTPVGTGSFLVRIAPADLAEVYELEPEATLYDGGLDTGRVRRSW